MVIEYIGEVIRTELSELREKLYEARVSFYLNCSLHYVMPSTLISPGVQKFDFTKLVC
jgi:hypothetical protein